MARKPQKDILAELNTKGFKNPQGEPFTRNSLDCFLRNERYTGTYIFDPSRKYKEEEDIEEDDLEEDSEHRIIRVDGGLPQIVSREVFDSVQLILDSRKNKPSARSKVEYLLTSKVVCGECGEFFTGSTHSKKGQPYCYYRCAYRKDDCTMVAVRKEALEGFVIDEMLGIVKNEKIVAQIIDRFVEFYKEKNSNNDFIKALEKEQINIEKKISNIMNALAESGNFSDVFRSKLDELTKQKRDVLASISREANINLDEFVSKERVRQSYFNVLELLKSGTVENKSTVINTLLNRVIVYKDRIEVFINLLPLSNASADSQITSKDLVAYSLLESPQTDTAAAICVENKKIACDDDLTVDFPSENHDGDP